MGQHLTVYHVRSQLAKTITDSYEPILRKPRKVQAFNLTTEMPFEARLFISNPKMKPPLWINFLREGFTNFPIPSRKNINAVLFIRIPYGDTNEIFAFTFGQGRHLLRPHSYDADYGLRVALNAMYKDETTPNRVKSVSTRTVAENTMRMLRQTDRRATFEDFGIDVQRDILSSITGIPVDTGAWSNQLSGSDSLTANPTITFNKLGEYCKSVMEHYGQDWYKQDFTWIDNQKQVNDPDLLDKLTKKVIDSIKEKTDNISLTIPELNEFEDIVTSYISYEGNIKAFDPYVDNLSSALEQIGLLDDMDVESINENLLFIVEYANEEDKSEWPLFDCLSGEIKYDLDTGGESRTYILSEGEFYEINSDYISALDGFIKNILENKNSIPDCHGNITEGKYNEQAAQQSPSLLLLDKQLVKVKGKTSPIEICDLLSEDGRFIHVKRKLSSSSLSHLFAQGYISAELLLENSDYRLGSLSIIKKQEKTKVLPPEASSCIGKFSFFSEQPIERGKFEVTYGIIAKWDGIEFVDALPFFSKVNLRKYVEDLNRIGYKVSYARIKII